MKIYTNVIKLIEKGLPLLIVGPSCSGKSTLLREISNFEISYTTFLMDCHYYTSVTQASSFLKNRVYLTQSSHQNDFNEIDSKLILVDDLSLSQENIPISQILIKILKEGTLTVPNNRQIWANKPISNVNILASVAQCSN